MALGNAASFAPDYGKGKQAAGRIFQLVDREPAIDAYSEEGTKLVSAVHLTQVHCASLPLWLPQNNSDVEPL